MTDQPERRRLHPEVEMVLQAIQSRDDAMTALRGDVLEMPERIGEAIQKANMRTVSDPAFWAAAGAALRREARDQSQVARRFFVDSGPTGRVEMLDGDMQPSTDSSKQPGVVLRNGLRVKLTMAGAKAATVLERYGSVRSHGAHYKSGSLHRFTRLGLSSSSGENMDWQNVAIALLGVASAIFGWFARELWAAVNQLKKDLSDLRVLIAEDYVRYDRLHEALKPIVEGISEIKAALTHKADKP